MKKYKDIIAGSVLFAMALGYFCMSFSIKLTYIDRVVGSRMFPQICGALMMALSAWLVIAGVVKLKRTNSAEAACAEETTEAGAACAEETADPQPAKAKTGLSSATKTVLVLVSFALFAWLMDKIGFLAAAFLYLFSQMLLMADRKPALKTALFYLLLSLALAVGIYFLFNNGFLLMLPKPGWF